MSFDNRAPRPAIVWDLDDTLCHTRHRVHHIQRREPDWTEFHRLLPFDKPVEHAVMLFNVFHNAGYAQLIFTSRPYSVLQDTQNWLMRHGLNPFSYIAMRHDDDNRNSVELKKEMLHRARDLGYKPVMAFEDHPDVVNMYRREGLPCWAADPASWVTSWLARESETNGARKEASNV